MPMLTVQVDVHHWIHPAEPQQPVLSAIAELKGTIMTTQAELATQLQALTEQTNKAKAEIIAKVTSLEEAIASAGNVTPEVQAALDGLKAAVQGVDDLNPDA